MASAIGYDSLRHLRSVVREPLPCSLSNRRARSNTIEGGRPNSSIVCAAGQILLPAGVASAEKRSVSIEEFKPPVLHEYPDADLADSVAIPTPTRQSLHFSLFVVCRSVRK